MGSRYRRGYDWGEKMRVPKEFVHAIRDNTGAAVIMAGSDSDISHIDRIVGSLTPLGIPYDVRICSAHKEPERLMQMINEYNAIGGTAAYIAVAGGTDALSGTLSFHAFGPVISCPPDAPNESCLKNPPGSSNVYLPHAQSVGPYLTKLFGALGTDQQKVGRVVMLAGRMQEEEDAAAKMVKALGEWEIPGDLRQPAHGQYFRDGEVTEAVASYAPASLLFISFQLGGALVELAESRSAAIVCSSRVGELTDFLVEAPVAAIRRPENATKFAAQLFSGINERCNTRIDIANRMKIEALGTADVKYRARYAARQGR